MLIAPYNTDAPIYHPPIATGGIIIVNVVVFFATTLQAMLGNIEWESIEWLSLQFNQINPVQWITAAFMHGDPMHLIGNMIFLWSFGLVVEGKIGAARFLAVYFLIAIVHMSMLQIPMYFLSPVGGAVGASAVIYGLLVIAVIWAPENEMDCFYWIGFIWWGTFEIRLISLGGIYIGLQILGLWLTGFQMSSAMGHMSGVIAGIPIAFFMLRQDMVDCEGWDLVSRNPWLQANPLLYSEKQRRRQAMDKVEDEDPVALALALEGRPPQPSQRKSRERVDSKQPAAQAQRAETQRAQTARKKTSARAVTQPADLTASSIVDKAKSHSEFNGLSFVFRDALSSGDVVASQQAFMKLDQKKIAVGLSDKLLFAYVSLLGNHKKWVDAMRPLNVIASKNGPNADDARLRVAQIQLKVLKNAPATIRTLQGCRPVNEQSTQQEHARWQQRNKMLQLAQEMI